MAYKTLNKSGNTKNAYIWVEKLLEKLFYESNGKRNDDIDASKIKTLSTASKQYLAHLYDHLESNRAIYLTAFKDRFKKTPETVEEKIFTIASNHFGGFGRNGWAQSKITTLPLPTNDVINDLIRVMMDGQRKQELVDLAKKLGLSE